MARDKAIIKAIIIDDLSDFDLTNSSTGIWMLFINAVVSCIYLFELIMDLFKSDIELLVASKRIGSRPWYVAQAKAFQLGDNLIFSADGKIYYPVIDETKQIIKRANAIQDADVLTIKVAKLSGDDLSPLTTEELLQFQKYINDVMIAGTKMQVVTLIADVIYVEANIYYNPIYSAAQVNEALDNALFLFKSTFEFDNYFIVNDFIDYIRNIDEVQDIVISVIEGSSGGDTVAISRSYEIKSGYFNFDDTSVFTLISIV